MKRLQTFTVSAICLGAWAAAHAQSTDIFVCTDDQGRKTYQNTGTSKGCKRLDSQPITTVTMPKARGGVMPAMDQRAASPSDFPKVDTATQRTRDNDRQRILQDELKVEEDKLARLKEEFNNGEPERRGDERNFARYQERVQRLQEEIQRAESNAGSLRRELGLSRTQ